MRSSWPVAGREGCDNYYRTGQSNGQHPVPGYHQARGGGPGEGIIVNPLIKRPVIAPQTVLLLQFGNRGNLLSEQEIGERREEGGELR